MDPLSSSKREKFYVNIFTVNIFVKLCPDVAWYGLLPGFFSFNVYSSIVLTLRVSGLMNELPFEWTPHTASCKVRHSLLCPLHPVATIWEENMTAL